MGTACDDIFVIVANTSAEIWSHCKPPLGIFMHPLGMQPGGFQPEMPLKTWRCHVTQTSPLNVQMAASGTPWA